MVNPPILCPPLVLGSAALRTRPGKSWKADFNGEPANFVAPTGSRIRGPQDTTRKKLEGRFQWGIRQFCTKKNAEPINFCWSRTCHVRLSAIYECDALRLSLVEQSVPERCQLLIGMNTNTHATQTQTLTNTQVG
jgi:hypothetical protein